MLGEENFRFGSSTVGLPGILGVGGPIGGDAYAGVSSTMRPSLQPYLASKSALQRSRAETRDHSARSARWRRLRRRRPDLDLRLRLDVAHPVGALALGNKVKLPAMFGEPDFDFTRLIGHAADGGQVEVHGTRSEYEHSRRYSRVGRPLRRLGTTGLLSGHGDRALTAEVRLPKSAETRKPRLFSSNM
jgi:hypothetical protein